MPRTVLHFSPRNAPEAAEIFRSCSAAAAAGRKIRAGVVESPFRPADGVELPAAPSSVWDIGTASGAAETLALVDHGGMNGIHEISRSDLLAVVGGGVKFGTFVDEARKAGLYFPHEPDAFTRDATIAELLMGAETFSTDGRFGNLREYVLALEIATPKGEIIRTGSRSVKDVTGYNIAGILMGSGGLCGMIAKATLRLLPAPGTRLQFLCRATSRGTLEKLAGEIHRKLAPAFLEISPYADTADERSSLIGELQSAVPGREEALLGEVSAFAPADLPVERLDPSSPEKLRHFPMFAIMRMEKGQRLLHAELGADLSSTHRHDVWGRRSFFPTRFHYYFAADSDVAPTLCGFGDGVVESIEMRGGSMFRRRLGRDEIAKLAGGVAVLESPAAAKIDREVYRIFDPQGIMVR